MTIKVKELKCIIEKLSLITKAIKDNSVDNDKYFIFTGTKVMSINRIVCFYKKYQTDFAFTLPFNETSKFISKFGDDEEIGIELNKEGDNVILSRRKKEVSFLINKRLLYKANNFIDFVDETNKDNVQEFSPMLHKCLDMVSVSLSSNSEESIKNYICKNGLDIVATNGITLSRCVIDGNDISANVGSFYLHGTMLTVIAKLNIKKIYNNDEKSAIAFYDNDGYWFYTTTKSTKEPYLNYIPLLSASYSDGVTINLSDEFNDYLDLANIGVATDNHSKRKIIVSYEEGVGLKLNTESIKSKTNLIDSKSTMSVNNTHFSLNINFLRNIVDKSHTIKYYNNILYCCVDPIDEKSTTKYEQLVCCFNG